MQKLSRWHWLSLATLALGGVIAVVFVWSRDPGRTVVAQEIGSRRSERGRGAVRVEVVHPKPGDIIRKTVRPGSVIAFESADLYAKISGYLERQDVDIGSRVKQGETLAVLDAPEFAKQVDAAKAALDQSRAEVNQAKARIVTAEAERDATVAYVKQAKAEVHRAVAMRRYRTQQRDRIAALSAAKAVEPRLVDEKEDEVEASIAAELAAEAGVATAEAKVSAAEASVVQARADLVAAEAKVEVAQAALDRASVFLAYTKIVSPYDGVVTRRSFFRGAFVRAAEQGGLIPLLSVSRTDLMRVVAQVPDRDVPLVSVGNVAKVNIDALPGEEFEGKVARMADSEDPVTRTMRVEVDLPNPHNKLREGMYGLVAIHLDSGKKLLTIPSSCLVGNVENDKGTVFVVENNVAHSRPVIVGSDSGLSTDVISGLSESDEVISRHSGALADGATVEATKSER